MSDADSEIEYPRGQLLYIVYEVWYPKKDDFEHDMKTKYVVTARDIHKDEDLIVVAVAGTFNEDDERHVEWAFNSATHVLLLPGSAQGGVKGLPKASLLDCSKLASVHRTRIRKTGGVLPGETLDEMIAALRIGLGLD